jgi:hypothetical protein
MKISLPVKLGIAVVLLFAIVIAGFLLYQPIRYNWLKGQLLSEDNGKVDEAVKTLAAEPKRSVPHLRKWLLSGKEKLVINSCRVLGLLKKEQWEQAMPELKSVFKGPPSEFTDKISKALIGDDSRWCNLFDRKSEYWTNFLCYYLIHDPESVNEMACLLQDRPDPRALERLYQVLQKDIPPDDVYEVARAIGSIGVAHEIDNTDILELLYKKYEDGDPEEEETRRGASYAIARIAHPTSKAILRKMLLDVHAARGWVAMAIGDMRDKEAIEPLAKALKSEEFEYPDTILNAFGMIGDPKAIPYLLYAVENMEPSDWSCEPDELRLEAVSALGQIRSPEAADALLGLLKNPKYEDIHYLCAMMLASFEGEEIDKALENASILNKNFSAKLALQWKRGFRKEGKIPESKDGIILGPTFYMYILAKWGDPEYLQCIFNSLNDDDHCYDQFTKGVLERMPDGFPEFDPKARSWTRARQEENVLDWYRKNKDRLAWDGKKEKYYLRSEETQKE